jgi:hypothetical protein
VRIVYNNFVRRQTPESRFSHFSGTEAELLKKVIDNFDMRQRGYREGVVLVPVDPEGFYSSVVTLSEGDILRGGFESRREGETPRKFLCAVDKEKEPAKSVEIVLYSSQVLSEDGDSELPSVPDNWEVISINASPASQSDIPIDPIILMHNHFDSDGGTDTHLSDSEFVSLLREGFEYWKDKALCE